MNGRFFVDSNVLVYSRDASEAAKMGRAREWLERLWEDRTGRISVQVLSEYFVTVTSKLSPGLNEGEAWSDVEALMAWRPVAIDPLLLRSTKYLEKRFGFSWWDSMIVAAAKAAGCTHLLTEDLQDGQLLQGLTVVNPFAHRIAEFL